MYELSSVSRSDEGSYLCKARNDAGEVEDMVQLIVVDDAGQYRPPYEYGTTARPPYGGDQGGVQVQIIQDIKKTDMTVFYGFNELFGADQISLK